MRPRFPAVLALTLFAWLLVLTPVVCAQSMFSQNKPEQAQAARLVIEDATVAMRASREAALAKGDTAAVAKWDKAIAAATHGAALATGIETGDVTVQDAAASGLLATLGPWGMLATPFALWGLREWRAAVVLKAVKKAEAEAKANEAAAKKDAEDNLAAAKSMVNMVDQIRIKKPEVAAAMKELASNSATNFTAALTPKAKDIIAAERLT